MGVGAIGRISSGSLSYIQPLRYPLENRAEVSEDYENSTLPTPDLSPARQVAKTSPVSYPDANAVKVKSPVQAEYAQAEEAQKTAAAYNRVAQQFGAATTGYGRGGFATSYELTGSSLDLLA